MPARQEGLNETWGTLSFSGSQQNWERKKGGNWIAGTLTEFKLIPARARSFFIFHLGLRPRRWFHHIFIGPASGILSFLVRMAVSRSRIVFCIVHNSSTQQRPFPVGFCCYSALILIGKLLSLVDGRRLAWSSLRRTPRYLSAGRNSS
jgi:hypothetical protein